MRNADRNVCHDNVMTKSYLLLKIIIIVSTEYIACEILIKKSLNKTAGSKDLLQILYDTLSSYCTIVIINALDYYQHI